MVSDSALSLKIMKIQDGGGGVRPYSPPGFTHFIIHNVTLCTVYYYYVYVQGSVNIWHFFLKLAMQKLGNNKYYYRKNALMPI